MIGPLKHLYSIDLETYMLLNANNFKDVNKQKMANIVSYFHIFIILNTILSFYYDYTLLHQMNIFLQICNFSEWIHHGYNITHYGKKDECIITRIENILRILDSKQKEEEYKKNKDPNKGIFKKYKSKDGYIKSEIYSRTGFIIPNNWINIIIHSYAGASLYNSYLFVNN